MSAGGFRSAITVQCGAGAAATGLLGVGVLSGWPPAITASLAGITLLLWISAGVSARGRIDRWQHELDTLTGSPARSLDAAIRSAGERIAAERAAAETERRTPWHAR
ncbi:MAG: hypothetical protein AAGF47_10485, partial [Planctomycetota bacterium]